MYISSLRIENFKSFYGVHDFTFSQGVNVVLGLCGEGKTSLCRAIEFGLFARARAKPIGAVHTDLIPFVTMSDFSKLNESALKVDLFHNRWARNFFEKLMAYLKPSTLIVFGRTNAEYFDRYFQRIALNKSYHINEKRSVKYGISSFNLGGSAVPLVGLSVNLGNPVGFTREMLNEFGAHIKGEIDLARSWSPMVDV